tara:strand:- start:4540 stop:4971 length:432 start_codon:yes stop_codon:yes gene_type:complete
MFISSLLQELSQLKHGEVVHEGTEEPKEKTKSQKSRVRTYNTIRDALSSGGVGEIFSTKGASRTYVISKGKWGKKSGRGKIAKGFTPGSSTPSSAWGSIKKHAARTELRHGKGSKELAQRYGSRSIKKARGIGGKDGIVDKGK